VIAITIPASTKITIATCIQIQVGFIQAGRGRCGVEDMA
jgi:hypothetical protein